jgi:hypothetical protein
MTSPGQPRSTSSGFTGDRVAGKPATAILLRYLLRFAECPRLRLACRADDVSPSILGHRILRSFAGDRSSSLPESRLLQHLRLLSSGCPRNSAPPNSLLMSPRASPGTTSSGCADGDRMSRPTLSCPPAMPIGGSPGSPGFHAFRPFRIRFLGLPRLCGYGWVDDVSPTSLELCILGLSSVRFPGCPRFMRPLAVPRMNLQAQSGRAIHA